MCFRVEEVPTAAYWKSFVRIEGFGASKVYKPLVATPACSKCRKNYAMSPDMTNCVNSSGTSINFCERYGTVNKYYTDEDNVGEKDGDVTGGICLCGNGQVYEAGLYRDSLLLACENDIVAGRKKVLEGEDKHFNNKKVVCMKPGQDPRDDGCRKCKEGYFMKNAFECSLPENFNSTPKVEDLSILNFFSEFEKDWMQDKTISASPDGGIKLFMKFTVSSNEHVTWLLDRNPVIKDETGLGKDCKCTTDPVTNTAEENGLDKATYGGFCECPNKQRYIVGSNTGTDATDLSHVACVDGTATLGDLELTDVPGVGDAGAQCTCPMDTS